jgi:hypothetical protein
VHFPLHAKQVLYNENGCRCASGTVPKPETERETDRQMIMLPCQPHDCPKQLQISNTAPPFSSKQADADFYLGSTRLEPLQGLRQP